jgi:subfamily B ATP-binding cassette protein MsbA
MKYLFRVLSHSVHYKLNIGLNLLFNILAIIFSALSLAMVAPFLQLLFKKDIETIIKLRDTIIKMNIPVALKRI